MEARDLLRIIRFNWMLILAATVLGSMVGLVMASVKDPEYSAVSQVFVAVTDGGSTGELAQGISYSQQQARNFSAVATKEIVLGPVIDDLGLDTTVQELRSRVSAGVQVNTSLISIDVQDRDPDRAAETANAIAKSLADAATALSPDIEGLKGAPIRLEIVEYAITPTRPTVPNTPLWILVAGAIGLLLGCGWVAIHELAVAKIRTREQFESIADLNHLGSVSEDRKIPSSPIALTTDPYSVRSEEYRKLRSSLQFLSPGESHKAFVVSSSVAGEGKSTTAANLAVTIAASGKRVCLVEADLRRPSLGAVLDLTGEVGLTTVLAGEAQLDDVLQPWGDHGLSVLLAGEVPPNPSELLESDAAQRLFAEVRSRFDVTIVDAPPILAVADTATLTREFGSAVLIVGAKRVQVREVRKAIEQFDALGLHILGYILTGARDTRRAYRYYQHQVPAPPAPVPEAPAEDVVATQASDASEPSEPTDASEPTAPVADAAELSEPADLAEVVTDDSIEETPEGAIVEEADNLLELEELHGASVSAESGNHT